MTHLILTVVRILISCFAFLLIYIAAFLHEDEEGKLQNRLEELWMRIDDLQSQALSRETVFLRELLRLLTRGFDGLLGKNLLSVRSITVVFCYCWASAALLNAYAIRVRLGGRPGNSATALWEWLEPTAFVLIGTLAAALPKRIAIEFLGGVSAFFIGYLANGLFKHPKWEFYYTTWFAGAVLAGSACGVAFVAINRIVFRFSARLNKGTTIILVLTANLLIAAAYAIPYLYWWYIYTILPPGFIFVVSSTNLLAVSCALSIVIVMLIAFLHRLFWPIVSRPMYAMARREVVRKPKLLLAIAIVLLSWALPGWKAFWDFVGKL